MIEIIVDFTKEIGKIKPIHAADQLLFAGINFLMFDYLKDAHML